jgi:hypothetical protein
MTEIFFFALTFVMIIASSPYQKSVYIKGSTSEIDLY